MRILKMDLEVPMDSDFDLLTTIGDELQQRLAQLRPAVSEYEQLLALVASLDEEAAREQAGAKASSKAKRPARKRAAGKQKPASPAVQASSHAILDALEHGSHTSSELVMVTAMSVTDIRAGLRRLQGQGKIAKVTREGKAAFALA
jgi:predicted Rossmann fold nucleotide-binding protein DprA/Smf involved in DNA uptake